MTTTPTCENFLQTIIRVLGNMLCYFAVAFVIAATIYVAWVVAMAMISAVFIMSAALWQTLRSPYTGEKPQLSHALLYTVFYVCASFVLVSLALFDRGSDLAYFTDAFYTTVAFTTYLLLKHYLPKLMRHSSRTVTTISAAVIAIIMSPVSFNLALEARLFVPFRWAGDLLYYIGTH